MKQISDPRRRELCFTCEKFVGFYIGMHSWSAYLKMSRQKKNSTEDRRCSTFGECCSNGFGSYILSNKLLSVGEKCVCFCVTERDTCSPAGNRLAHGLPLLSPCTFVSQINTKKIISTRIHAGPSLITWRRTRW